MKNFNILWLGILALAFTITLGSCAQKPYEKPEFQTIGPNETAFLIPVSGKTSDQKSLSSEDYLKSNQVATKQVQIPHVWVQDGRAADEGHYQATVVLIKVDRTPVSVTWLPPPDGDKATAVGVEDADSIGITPGVALTAMIDEPDAAKYLYKYAGKPLKDVVNTDVNNFVKSQMSAEFSKLTLKQAMANKNDIAVRVFKNTKDQFAPYGVTITQLGLTNGMVYDNQKIQDGIDNQAVAEAATKTQIELNKKQELENTRVKSVADADAYVRKTNAQAFAQNEQASIAQKQLEIDMVKANAMLEWAKAGGQLPSVLPENVWLQSDFSKFGGNTPKK